MAANDIKEGTLTFSGFLGLAPAGTSRTNLQFGEPYQLANATAIDPLSTIGILSPGKAPGTNLDVTSALAAKIIKFLPNDFGSYQGIYGIEAGAKIHQATGDGAEFDNTPGTGFPVTISGQGTHAAHTTFVCEDIIATQMGGGGTQSFYVSWNDGSDGDVAKFDLTGGTPDADWFSTRTGGQVLTNNVPHPMVWGENNYLYIADGHAIHKWDEANSVATAAVIDLPQGWIIQDMLPYKGYLWILAMRLFTNGTAWPLTSASNPLQRATGVFVWNYQGRKSAEFTGFEKGTPYILDNVTRAHAIFTFEGVPHVFTLGSNNRTQIRRFTGTSFQVVMEEPGDILPIRGGIATYFNNILWADRQTGNLYTFGRISRNLPETLNKIGATGAATGGIVLDSQGRIWASYGTSSVKVMDGMALSASASTLTKQLPKFSRIKRITIFFPPQSDTTASNSLTLSTYKNFSSSAISKTLTATHAGDLARGWVTFKNLGGEDWRGFHAASFKLDWTNTAGVTTSFKPYRIEVDYQVEGQDL